jgi:hypothetical protein
LSAPFENPTDEESTCTGPEGEWLDPSLQIVDDIAKLKQAPLRLIGQNFFTKGAVESRSSGAKVGPIHVLTSAHNFHDDPFTEWKYSTNGWSRKFFPGRGGTDFPNGTFNYVGQVISGKYLDTFDSEFDFAVGLVEDTPAFFGLGHFGLCWKEIGWFKGKTFVVHGHPGSMIGMPPAYCANGPNCPEGEPNCGDFMYSDVCEATGVGTNNLINNDCVTLPGMSGGPVWRLFGLDPCIYGVHATSTSFVPITKSKYDAILEVICDFPSQFGNYPLC